MLSILSCFDLRLRRSKPNCLWIRGANKKWGSIWTTGTGLILLRFQPTSPLTFPPFSKVTRASGHEIEFVSSSSEKCPLWGPLEAWNTSQQSRLAKELMEKPDGGPFILPFFFPFFEWLEKAVKNWNIFYKAVEMFDSWFLILVLDEKLLVDWQKLLESNKIYFQEINFYKPYIKQRKHSLHIIVN